VTFTVRQLAALVQGNVVGDGDLVIHSAHTLQEAQAGDISFAENDSYGARLDRSQASAAVVPLHFLSQSKTLIQVHDPLMAFCIIVQHLQGKAVQQPSGIDPRASVHPSVKIGPDISIHSFASVGENTVMGARCQLHQNVIVGKNCRLGDDVVLFPNTVLYDDIVLGNRVIIHANSVIGADGFGFRFQKGRHVKVPQLSGVIIGDDVEIGACSTVDHGTFEPTVIGEGTKLDNHVQVAHNCRIGKHNLLAAQTGVGGSTKTGDYVFMGGQVGIKDHITIGAGAMLGAKAGIISNVPAGARMFLYPAHEEKEAARILACMKKLPAMRKDLVRIMKELNLTETADAARNPEAA
jgi:UDP-3-O-[3-hydroxymyristoyl] glucosamine N-acyltransferase